MLPTESITVSSAVTPIDLKPPQEWLDDFPLSRKEIKAFNTSLEWAFRLPRTAEEFQKELSLDGSAMKKFQADIDLLVKLYIKFRTYAEDYRANMFPFIMSIAKDLRAHTIIVESHYSAVYSGLKDFKDKDGNHEWPRMLINQVGQRVALQMDRTSIAAKTATNQLSTLKDKIGADKLAAMENIDRLKKKQTPRPSENDGEATPLEIVQLQYDLFNDSLSEILENATIIIAILDSLRDQIISIRDDFNVIREATQGNDVPTDLIASDSSQTVYRQWHELSTILSELLTL